MADSKHTIYIDVDDEITSIIDKVKSAPDKIVALVLPKRATVLQSIVNMKLLKKSAASAKKNIVLITSEAGLLPLAGVVGLHVAKSLQSKPVIPPPPDRLESTDPEISEEEPEPLVDKTKSIGSLAAAASMQDADGTETIELDNETDTAGPAAAVSSAKKKLAKRFKVPNFDKFRIGFFLGILALIVLVVGWILAAIVLPKAIVTIKTDTSTVTSTLSFNANTATQNLDVDKALVPAVAKEVKKTDTEKTTASGKKDTGAKATGTLTIKNCEDSSPRTVPAGTVVSASGKSFTMDAGVTVPAGTFSGGGTVCTSSTVNVGVTASNSGDGYNLGASTYTSSSAALSGNFRLNGTATAGGTSKIVSVVSQDDIDGAVAKMKGRLDQDAIKELNQLLQAESLEGLDETRVISTPVIKTTPAVDQEATGEVTVTAETTYNELGVKKDYLVQLVKKDVESKIDKTKQSILDDGLGSAVFRLETRKSPTEAQISLQTIAIAGPELNEASIKDQIRGKKRGDAEKVIGGLPGVKDVSVEYKPFWVLSTPKASKKITIIIEKPTVTKPADSTTNAAP